MIKANFFWKYAKQGDTRVLTRVVHINHSPLSLRRFTVTDALTLIRGRCLFPVQSMSFTREGEGAKHTLEVGY